MNRSDIDALREEFNTIASRFETLLARIEASLPPETQAAATVAAEAPKTNAETDQDENNPWITRDPQAWKGPPMTGHRADECPIDYLETLVAAYAYRTRAFNDIGKTAEAEQSAKAARIIDAIIKRKVAGSAGQKDKK